MSKVKDEFFTDQEPEESFQVDPLYEGQWQNKKPEPPGIMAIPATETGLIALALSKAQGELSNVEKTHAGYQNRYKFADLGQVLDVIRPVFSKYGLAFTQLVGDAPEGRVSVTTMILHESGQTLQTTSSMALQKQAGISDAQAAGSVITYLRRYQITAMAGIAQEDTDAAIEEKPKKTRKAPDNFQKPVPNPDVIRALLACEDLPTLQEMWTKLGKDKQKLYEGVKEQRKNELQTKQADEDQKEL